MKNSIRLIPAATLLALLTGCSQSPKSLVESHLQLIKDGKQAEANDQYCIPKESLKLHTITAFKVPQLKADETEGASVQVVFPEIQTSQFRFKTNPEGSLTSEKEQLKTVKIQVWKSDDFYQRYVKSTAEVNNLTRTTSLITGSKPDLLPQPTREDVNSAPICVIVEADGVSN
jgi:hypothetical protein